MTADFVEIGFSPGQREPMLVGFHPCPDDHPSPVNMLVDKVDFAAMSMQQAQELCDAWVATEDARLAALERLFGGPVALTRAGLVESWTWFVQWHDAGGWEQPTDTWPMWMRPVEDGEPGYNAAACLAVDGLLAQLGKTALATVPGAGWKVYHDPKHANYDRQMEPTLWHPGHGHPTRGFHLGAIDLMLAMVWGVGHQDLGVCRLPDRLALGYDRCLGDYDAVARAAADLKASKRQAIVPGLPVPAVPDPPPVPAPRRGPVLETGADLVAFMKAGHALWEVVDDVDDEDGGGALRRLFAGFATPAAIDEALDERPCVQVGFADELVDLAGGVIDGLLDDLREANLPGVARVYREDREVITLEPLQGSRIRKRPVARIVKKRVRQRLDEYGPLGADTQPSDTDPRSTG